MKGDASVKTLISHKSFIIKSINRFTYVTYPMRKREIDEQNNELFYIDFFRHISINECFLTSKGCQECVR